MIFSAHSDHYRNRTFINGLNSYRMLCLYSGGTTLSSLIHIYYKDQTSINIDKRLKLPKIFKAELVFQGTGSYLR